MTIELIEGQPLPEIEVDGDQIRLRPFDDGDLALIEEASSDELIPLITTVPSEWSRDAGLAFIERQRGRLIERRGWPLAITNRSTDQAVGMVGLWIPNLVEGRVQFGYWVGRSGRGNGVAATALKMLSDWALEHLDVHRLNAFIEPWNTASMRTAERAGFEREALLRQWDRVGGVPKDMYAYTRLRD